MAELLRFRLERVRLPSILQLVESEGLTGRISLPGGEILLLDGGVVGARTGDLEGRPALGELFLVASGQASLEDHPSRGASLGPMMSLVIDGCRRADDWERFGALVLGPAAGARLPEAPDRRRVIEGFDGKLAVFEVVDRLGIHASILIDVVAEALETGLLVEAGPPLLDAFVARRRPDDTPLDAFPPLQAAPAPAPPTPRPEPATPSDDRFGSLLELGRSHLRNGRMGEAEEAFLAALAERPDDRIAAQNLKRLLALRTSDRKIR
jgi:hypothetical protein